MEDLALNPELSEFKANIYKENEIENLQFQLFINLYYLSVQH